MPMRVAKPQVLAVEDKYLTASRVYTTEGLEAESLLETEGTQ